MANRQKKVKTELQELQYSQRRPLQPHSQPLPQRPSKTQRLARSLAESLWAFVEREESRGCRGNQRAHQGAKIIRDSCDEAAADVRKYTRRHEMRRVNVPACALFFFLWSRTRMKVSSRVALRRRQPSLDDRLA